jgi:hypothetical protein
MQNWGRYERKDVPPEVLLLGCFARQIAWPTTLLWYLLLWEAEVLSFGEVLLDVVASHSDTSIFIIPLLN